MRSNIPLILLAILTGIWLRAAVCAEPLVTHLDVDHVDVSTRFQGQRILLFGAVPQGTDVIIKVVSPEQEVDLARKSRIGPLWLDSGHVTVHGAPGLMYLMSSRPIGELLDSTEHEELGLTLSSALKSAALTGDAATDPRWRAALLRLKRRVGYYVESEQGVELEGGRLFYAHIDLPPESPLGIYRMSIYLLRDREVVQRQHENLVVQEVRLEHWISNVAHGYAWSFGALLSLSMMVLGLLLGVAMRSSQQA